MSACTISQPFCPVFPLSSLAPHTPRPPNLSLGQLRPAPTPLSAPSPLLGQLRPFVGSAPSAMWQGQGKHPQQEQMARAAAPPGSLVGQAAAASGRLIVVLGQLVANASAGHRVAEDMLRGLFDGLASLVELAEHQAIHVGARR